MIVDFSDLKSNIVQLATTLVDYFLLVAVYIVKESHGCHRNL